MEVIQSVDTFIYADDTILFTKSSDDLQIILNEFSAYCKKWKLKIIFWKTKVLIL